MENTKSNVPRDNSGIPVICYYNTSTEEYEPVLGHDNAQYTSMRYYDVLTPLTNKANNATVTLTEDGTDGLSWYIGYMNYRMTGGTTGGADIPITLLDGTTTVYESNIAKTATEGTSKDLVLGQPIKITEGNSFTFSIGASGTDGTYIIINMGVFQR